MEIVQNTDGGIASPNEEDSFKNNMLSKIEHLTKIQRSIGYRQTEREEEFINTLHFYINKMSFKLSKLKHYLNHHQKTKRSKTEMIFGTDIDLAEKREFILSSNDCDISLDFVESLNELSCNADRFAQKVMNFEPESLEIMRLCLRVFEDAYYKVGFDLEKITSNV
jgi:hypothetical protein